MNFHVSIGVRSLEKSKQFYRYAVRAEITYEGDYLNLGLYWTQITIKENSKIIVDLPDFHFGIYLPLDEFEKLEKR